MAYRKLWTWLLQDNALYVPVPQGAGLDGPGSNAAYERYKLSPEYRGTSYHTIVDPDGIKLNPYLLDLYNQAQAATKEKEDHMSHESHSGDEYGTYSALCPQCNHPWLAAILALMEYHFPVTMNGREICDKCNRPGGGDTPWPCDTAYIIKREIGPTLFESLVEARNGHSRDRQGARQGDHNPEEVLPPLRGSSGVRGVPEPAPGNGEGDLSSGVLSPTLSALFGRSRGEADSDAIPGGPVQSRPEGAPASETPGVLGAPALGKPELTWKQCGNRRRPSSVEKCGIFLVQVNGWWVCVEHGPRSEVK